MAIRAMEKTIERTHYKTCRTQVTIMAVEASLGVFIGLALNLSVCKEHQAT
jgi:hypothetical protein